MSARCWGCGNGLDESDFGRQMNCQKCLRDTHVCKNCKHYNPSLHNECGETQADRVLDKEKANFCDYFSINPMAGNPLAGAGAPTRDALKAAAEALFKKGSSS